MVVSAVGGLKMENKNPKILIADDDKGLLSDLEKVLLREPFSAFFVNNAEREIEEARTGKYDFILTDLQMPNDEDGIYAIREIRKFSQAPIVLHTSYENEVLWNKAKEAGANEVISKNATSLFDYAGIIRRYLK